jgi:hypothetical protein
MSSRGSVSVLGRRLSDQLTGIWYLLRGYILSIYPPMLAVVEHTELRNIDSTQC